MVGQAADRRPAQVWSDKLPTIADPPNVVGQAADFMTHPKMVACKLPTADLYFSPIHFPSFIFKKFKNHLFSVKNGIGVEV